MKEKVDDTHECKKKILEMVLENITDDYGYVREQSIIDINGEDVGYWLHNLNECPEDATIDRDLFDAYDYVNALKKGIELAKKGYIDINIKDVEEGEE